MKNKKLIIISIIIVIILLMIIVLFNKDGNKENSYICEEGTNLSACIKSLYKKEEESKTHIYLHDSSLENGAEDGSYRFAGGTVFYEPNDQNADVVNNHVCFGSDEIKCPTENSYSIIGVFGDKVKLIKNVSTNEFDAEPSVIGKNGAFSSCSDNGIRCSYYWSSADEEQKLNNDWSESQLNKTNLNKNFIEYLGQEWVDKIAVNKWYVGGLSYANGAESNAKTAFDYEVGKYKDESKSYEAKIGLMYLSDFYYAADPKFWTYPGSTKDLKNSYVDASHYSWMYTRGWTISPVSDTKENAFSISILYKTDSTLLENTNNVYPVFYLNEDVKYVSGFGSKNDPIRIK